MTEDSFIQDDDNGVAAAAVVDDGGGGGGFVFPSWRIPSLTLNNNNVNDDDKNTKNEIFATTTTTTRIGRQEQHAPDSSSSKTRATNRQSGNNNDWLDDGMTLWEHTCQRVLFGGSRSSSRSSGGGLKRGDETDDDDDEDDNNNNHNNNDDDKDNNYKEDWESTTTATTISTGIIRASVGFARLQAGRTQVHETLVALMKTMTMTNMELVGQGLEESPFNQQDALLLVKTARQSLIDYARLLKSCREEMQQILQAMMMSTTTETTERTTTTENGPTAEQQGQNNFSNNNKEDIAWVFVEDNHKRLLPLKWNDRSHGSTTNNYNTGHEWIRHHQPPFHRCRHHDHHCSSTQSKPSMSTTTTTTIANGYLSLWTSIVTWEETHVYWNLSLCEMYQALLCLSFNNDRPGWKQAGTHWQTAASWMQYVRIHCCATTTSSSSSSSSHPVDHRQDNDNDHNDVHHKEHDDHDDNPRKAVVSTNDHDDDKNIDITKESENNIQNSFYLFWEVWMMAEAQRAAYQFVVLAPRPSHLMMAKLAAGAVPLFAQAVAAATTTTTITTTTSDNNIINNKNANLCQCWHLTLSALAEYHQAMVHSTKATSQQQALIRLHQRVLPMAQMAQELLAQYQQQTILSSCQNNNNNSNPAAVPWSGELYVQELQQLINTQWPAIQHLTDQLEEMAATDAGDGHDGGVSNNNKKVSMDVVVADTTLTDIAPQTLVKVQPLQVVQGALSSSLSSSSWTTSSFLFPRLSEHAQRYRQIFQFDLDNILQQTIQAAERQTEQAQQVLDKVDLPHALTCFQEQIHKQQQQQHEAAASLTSPMMTCAAVDPTESSSFFTHSSAASETTTSSSTTTTSAAAAQKNSIGSACAASSSSSSSSLHPTHRAAFLWQRVQDIQQGTTTNTTMSLPKGHEQHHRHIQQQQHPDHNMDNSHQRVVGLNQLQQGLWDLRDNAEEAHELLEQIQLQLQENLELDAEFTKTRAAAVEEDYNNNNRQVVVGGGGVSTGYISKHEVIQEIQETYWRSLRKYQQLLQSAASGDQVLFGRGLDFLLPTNPKFQLLSQLTKSQIEQLVLNCHGGRNNNNNSSNIKASVAEPQPTRRQEKQQQRLKPPLPPPTELQDSVERLNMRLMELSILLQKRQDLVHDQLPLEMKDALTWATDQLWQRQEQQQKREDDDEADDDDEERQLEEIMQQAAQPVLRGILEDIRSNLNEQTSLLKLILQENETFHIHKNSWDTAVADNVVEVTTRRDDVAVSAGSSQRFPTSKIPPSRGSDGSGGGTTHPFAAAAAASPPSHPDDMYTHEDEQEDEYESNYYGNFAGGNGASIISNNKSNMAPAAERTLIMLEEALEEMEQFTAHWQQGEAFYQGVIPKLQKLQQQVSEVSTRFAIDRCEYDDQLARSTQEAKDAAMAARLAEDDRRQGNENSNNNDHSNSSGCEAENDAAGIHTASIHTDVAPQEHRPVLPPPRHDNQLGRRRSSNDHYSRDHRGHDNGNDDERYMSFMENRTIPNSNEHYHHHPQLQQSLPESLNDLPPGGLPRGLINNNNNTPYNSSVGSIHNTPDTISMGRGPTSSGEWRRMSEQQQGRAEQQQRQPPISQQQQQQQYRPLQPQHPSQPQLIRRPEERQQRQHQEPMTQLRPQSSADSHRSHGSLGRSSSGSNFVYQVRNQENSVVDDEKVASLVAMEFDPERVVAALQKYDNNMERALNELLGTSYA